MMLWLVVIILAYLFFSFSSLGDKLVLAGKPQPLLYTFYTGILGAFVVFFIPFAPFHLPSAKSTIWIILDAIVHLAGLYTMYVALKKFEVSKVVTTIGATQPLFIFALTWLFFGPQPITTTNISAFIILLVGTIIISFEKNALLLGSYLKITVFSSLMFSFDYVFSKIIFLDQPFLQGIIWMRICICLFAALFLLKKSFRKEIFTKQVILDHSTQRVFIYTQICGGIANFLQSYAVALVPIAYLATMNSLRGMQYAFLFLLTAGLSIFYPKTIHENISKTIFTQKIVAITLIVVGLSMVITN